MKVSAVLKMPKSVKKLTPFAQSVVTAMSDNASFPSPTPALATVSADIAALETAESAVLSRTKGAVETRNLKLATVRTDLEHLLAYAQQVADGNLTTAESVIQSAGMSVRKVTLHDRAPLAVKQGTPAGTAHLAAKAAGRRASYEWQYSTDQKTWTNAPSTLQAKTSVTGLTVGTTYAFRVRPVLASGEQNWTALVSIVMN
jgi:hypothetical protein